eukprot:7376869-Prymnesium_polylepis.1
MLAKTSFCEFSPGSTASPMATSSRMMTCGWVDTSSSSISRGARRGSALTIFSLMSIGQVALVAAICLARFGRSSV